MSTERRWNDNGREKSNKAYSTKKCLSATSNATNSTWLTCDTPQASVLRGRRRIARRRELRVKLSLIKIFQKKKVGGGGGLK